MLNQLKYIELKTGYSDDGPAWIGMVQFSNLEEQFTLTGGLLNPSMVREITAIIITLKLQTNIGSQVLRRMEVTVTGMVVAKL